MRSWILIGILLSLASCTTTGPEVVAVRVKTKDSRLNILGSPICLTETEDMDIVDERGLALCTEAALYKDRKLATYGEESCLETKLAWSVSEVKGRYQKKLRIDFVKDGTNMRIMIAAFLSESPELTEAAQSTLCGALFYAFARNEHYLVVPVLTSSDLIK
jgi:hypothetical protein